MKIWTLKRMVMLTLIGAFVGIFVNNFYDTGDSMWWLMALTMNIICISLVDYLNGGRYE